MDHPDYPHLFSPIRIGDVTEVHIWLNRPMWPHGMKHPAGSDPVPDTFNWDRWLGPAPKRPWGAHWPDCAVPLSELVLLGCVAVRTGTHFKWDGLNMRFTNSEDADRLVKPNYENGWKL